MWSIVAAFAAPPSADAFSSALAEVPLDVAVALRRCGDPPPPAVDALLPTHRGADHGPLAVQLTPAVGEAWGCLVARDHNSVPNLASGGDVAIPSLTVACAPGPAECSGKAPPAGAFPPFVGPRFAEGWRALHGSVDGVGSVSAETARAAPELVFVRAGGASWIALRTPTGLRWSRSLGNGPGPDRVLGALPAVPLAALFGRPAWGLVGMEYGEARGTSAFSESAFSLVTVVDEGDRLAVAAAASLGEDVWGGEGGGRSDVTCPRMRTEALALVESCPEWASGAPRLFHAGPFPYEEGCAPECTAGRAVRTVLVPRGETLVPRDAVPVRAIGELDPEALSVLERRSSAVRLRLVGSAADLRGMVVRVGDQLGVVEAPCPIAPSRPVWLAGGDGDPMVAGTCWVGDLALDGAVDLLRPDGVVLEHLDPL